MVLEELGRGGMGIVYRCHDRQNVKDVAVKVIGWNNSNEEIVRFHKEAKALAQLQHPNILQVEHFGHSDDDSLFLVMNLLQGRSLSELLEAEKNPPFEDALDIFMQICEGLAHAHSKKILHRDIKPSNVFVARYAAGEFKVTITDFGLAKLLSEDQRQTQTNIAMGSPPYMSPEQCAGKLVDERSDIYSLGCLMFEVLTGTRPFLADTIPALMMQHMKEEPPSLVERAPDHNYPPEIDRILKKCLAKEPDQRYARVKDLHSDLKALRDSIVNVTFDSGDSGVYSPAKSFLRTGAFIISGIQNSLRPSQEKKFILALRVGLIVIGVLGALALYKLKPQKFEIPTNNDNTLMWAMSSKQAATNRVISTEIDPEDDLFLRKNAELATKREPGRIRRENTVWLPVATDATERLTELANATKRTQNLFNMSPDWLDLSRSDVTDDDLMILETMDLKGLNLARTSITDKGLETLSKMPTLVELNLDHTKVTDAGVKKLSKLPKLELLSLANTAVSDAVVKPLNACGKLSFIRFDNCKDFRGSTLEYLHDNYDLFHLSLRASGLDKSNLQKLKDVRLPSLDISELNLTDADLKTIADLHIPDLETLAVNHNKALTDTGLNELVRVKRLVMLSLNGCTKITADGVNKFQLEHSLPPTVISASHLNLKGTSALEVPKPVQDSESTNDTKVEADSRP